MTRLEQLLRRDQIIVVGALLFVTILAWAYMFSGAGMNMSSGEMDSMNMQIAWTPGYATIVFLMWWIMMVAMMLPSASPTVLLFAKINRQRREAGKAYVAAGTFAFGYLLTWGLFSALATAVQWALAGSGLLSMAMVSTNETLSAAILIAAGLWQFTPLKRACLRHCRSPFHFVVSGFRPGEFGALRMGMEHGAFCLGCCWFLMALLFYGGVMNLYWIASLALYVLIEKTVTAGDWFARLAGAGLIAWGCVLLFNMSFLS